MWWRHIYAETAAQIKTFLTLVLVQMLNDLGPIWSAKAVDFGSLVCNRCAQQDCVIDGNGFAEKVQIPPTAVGGWFKSSLQIAKHACS